MSAVLRLGLPALACCLLAAAPAAGALELHPGRGSAFDLQVSGRLAGVPAGGTRYVSWADLRKLPVARLSLPNEFVPGTQVVTAVFLDDLWRALPCGAGSDVLLATCDDGYASVFTREFIGRYRPFLVLEINGRGPDRWPLPGWAFNPGPYVILISSTVVPGADGILDASHKKPWGVVRIEIASQAERFRDITSGPWAALSPRGRAGREIWINSCASCHRGPGGTFGGSKSRQSFLALQSLAVLHPGVFKAYIRDPRAVVPGATMPAHGRYTDQQLEDIVAFVTACSRGR
jgi:cytochrome c2